MPLYVQNGNLIQKSGALGTSAGCCCKVFNETCACSGGNLPIPQAVLATFTLGALQRSSQTPPYCAYSEVESFINATYVLPFYVSVGSIKTYRVQLSNGLLLTLSWFCQSAGLGTISFSMDYCKWPITECFNYLAWRYQFTGPALCQVTYGSTDSIVSLTDAQSSISFGSGTYPSCQLVGNPSQTYASTLSLVPQW
jgi:hypothetical protein